MICAILGAFNKLKYVWKILLFFWGFLILLIPVFENKRIKRGPFSFVFSGVFVNSIEIKE